MNTWLYLTLRLLHLLAMAVWIGGATVAPLGLRRSLAAGPEHAKLMVARLQAATKLIVPAGLATLLSGMGLIVAAGGPAHVSWRILVGAGLTLCIFVLGATLGSPAMNRLEKHLTGGGDMGTASALAERFLKVINVEMAIRLVVLLLMVFRF